MSCGRGGDDGGAEVHGLVNRVFSLKIDARWYGVLPANEFIVNFHGVCYNEAVLYAIRDFFVFIAKSGGGLQYGRFRDDKNYH